MSIIAQPFVLSTWKSVCFVLVQSALSVYGDISVSKKNMSVIGQIILSTC